MGIFRIRFTIRGLLVAALFAAFGTGWLALVRENDLRQRSALEEIRKKGGFVDLGPIEVNWLNRLLFGERPFEAVQEIRFGPDTTDDDIRCIQGMKNLKTLSLYETSVTDIGMSHIKDLHSLTSLSLNSTLSDTGLWHVRHLKELEILNLGGTRITDDGMKYIAELPKLGLLDLRDTAIGDDGMADLAGLSQLESLQMQRTKITDKGIVHLKGLSNLTDVELDQNNLTDACLENFKGMMNLGLLGLNGTEVTEEGAGELEKALNNCDVQAMNRRRAKKR